MGETGKTPASIIGDLLDIIASHVFHKFACIVQSDIIAVLANVSEQIGDTMLAIAGYTIVGGVSRWRDIQHYTIKPEYVFEDGDKGKGSLIKVIKAETGAEPIFRPKKDNPRKGRLGFTPLQASDILAYEVKKLVEACDGPPLADFRFRFPYTQLSRIQGEPKILDQKGAKLAHHYLAINKYFIEHPLGGIVQ
jgi:hypothetical protein